MKLSFHRIASVCRLTAIMGLLTLSTVTAQIVQISHQAWTDVYNPTGNIHAGYPHILGFEALSGGNIVRKFLINWSATGDYAPWNNDHAWATSLDGGASWEEKQISPLNLDATAGIKKRDGTLLAVPFFPKYPPTVPTTTFTTLYHTSTDDASTWIEHGTYDAGSGTVLNGGVVDFSPNACFGMRFHRGIIEENNGDLYAPVYVRFTSDLNWRVTLVKSTNGGQLWKYFSTIKLPPSATAAATETALGRCANGDWLTVMRYDSSRNRSDDPESLHRPGRYLESIDQHPRAVGRRSRSDHAADAERYFGFKLRGTGHWSGRPSHSPGFLGGWKWHDLV